MPISATDRAPDVVREAVTPALKDSPQRWWLLALLFFAMLIGYAHRGALGVAAPFLSKELNLSKATIGVMLSAFFWVYSFMQVPSGWLADRFGVRRVYALGFAFWSLASTLMGVATSVAAMLGSRIAMGVGQAIAFPATARAVADWFKERERGTVTGVYLTGVRLGTALINWFGALYLASHGWKLFFLLTGLTPLLWLLPWTLFLRKWETQSVKQMASANMPSFVASLKLLRQRSALGIFLGFFAYNYAWNVFIAWLPGYLALERNFTSKELSVYTSVPYLAMSVIILLAGVLSDALVRRGYAEIKVRKLFILAGLAVGCLIVPAGLVGDKLTAVWLLTFSLCGLGLASPNTWTLTQAVSAKKIVGTVSGMQNFGGNLGAILAPALTGFIAQATGSFALALGLVGALLVLGMFAYWFLIDEPVEASV